jgi:spore germination protein YaaH
VTAWLPYWIASAARASAAQNGEVIGTASPYWYAISGDSTVRDEPGAGDAAEITQLRADGEQVVPMVTEQSGMVAFERILASKRRRAAMVRTLVGLASHDGYAGLDLDFESFAYDPEHQLGPADRIAALYPTFVAQACTALHAIGRSCDVAVMARTTSARVFAHGDIAIWTYDYSALAHAADHIQVMAYDDHSPGGPTGPIAPLPWVRQILAYARSQSGSAQDELGIPAYGYDWYGSTSASAVFARQVPQLLAKTHAHLHWSASEGEETFVYKRDGHKHRVWYEDATAGAERAKLAQQAGFSGVAIWAAGYEQPDLWQQLGALRRTAG